MPINKVTTERDEARKFFEWDDDDKFVVANWENNTTIAHVLNDELYEIIGTESTPETYANLKRHEVDVDALFVAGQLGVFRNGEYVFYRDNYESYDDQYYDEPLQSRGFSFTNNALDLEKRRSGAEVGKQIKVDPYAVNEKDPNLKRMKERLAADANSSTPKTSGSSD